MTFAMCSSWRPSVRGLLAGGLAGLMVFGIVAARVSPEGVTGAAEGLLRVLRDLGFTGSVIFAVLQAVVAVSGILPASLLGVAAGAIYGLVPGFLLAGISVMGDAVLAFFLSRSLFRPTVDRLAARRLRLRRLESLIVQDGWKLVCMLRISPILPFSATSYMLGLSSIGRRDYAVGTLASLPALCGYVFIGTLADAGLSAWTTGADPVRWTLLGVGGLATLVLTIRSGQIAMKLWPASQAEEELALAIMAVGADTLGANRSPGFAMPVVVICLLAAVALQSLGGAYSIVEVGDGHGGSFPQAELFGCKRQSPTCDHAAGRIDDNRKDEVELFDARLLLADLRGRKCGH